MTRSPESSAPLPTPCHRTFTLHQGWLPLTVELCEQVDRLLGPDKDAFHWVQFKEKLGSARFHRRWLRQPHDESVKEAVSDAVNQAVLASARTCIVCGAPAPVAEPDAPLCTSHEALRADRRWEPVAALYAHAPPSGPPSA